MDSVINIAPQTNCKHFYTPVVALLLALVGGQCAPAQNKVEAALQKLGGIDRNGNLIMLHHKAPKKAVVNFFALNCPPCFHELPSLTAIHRTIEKKHKDKAAFYLIAYTQTGENAQARPIEDIPPTGNPLTPAQKKLLSRLDGLWGGPAPVLFADNIFPYPNPLVVATPETLILKRRAGKLNIAYHLVGSIDSAALQLQKQKDGYILEGGEIMARFKKEHPEMKGNLSDPKNQKKFELFRDALLLDQGQLELKQANYNYIKDQRVAYLLNKLAHSKGSDSEY